MALFGLGKKKEEEARPACTCGCCDGPTVAKAAAGMDQGAAVKILGSGCAKCNALEAAAKEALTELNMDTTIDHVTDFAQIAAYGVMSTPALVVDGKVVSVGKVLKKDEVIAILNKRGGNVK